MYEIKIKATDGRIYNYRCKPIDCYWVDYILNIKLDEDTIVQFPRDNIIFILKKKVTGLTLTKETNNEAV